MNVSNRLTRRSTLVALAVAAVAIALVIGVLVARGGDDRPAAAAPAPPPPPPLVDADWTTDSKFGEDVSLLSSLSTAQRLVVSTRTHLEALDPATGARLWRTPVGELCFESGPTQEDLVAIVTVARGRAQCRSLSVVDLDTGDRLWSARTRLASGSKQLDVSRRTVSYQAGCGDLLRFDLTSGRQLPTLELTNICEGVGLGGGDLRLTSVERDGRLGDLVLADSDTDRRLARVRGYAGDPALKVYAIVSRDPLIIDVAHRLHRVLRLIGEDGRPVRYLGYQQDLSSAGRHDVLGIADDVLVVTFSDIGSLTTYGIDLTTGEVLWTRGPDDSLGLVGLHGTDLIGRRWVDGELWLTRADVRDDPGVTEVLGRLGSAPTADGQPLLFGDSDVPQRVGMVGDRVVVVGAEGAASYPVPEQGDGVERAAADDEGPTSGFEEGDFRPDDGGGCHDVSPRVFELLNWGTEAALPPSAGCAWSHRSGDDDNYGWSMYVDLTTFVTVPGPEEQGDAPSESPREVAARSLTDLLPDGAVEAPDIGDEAWILRRGGYKPELTVWVRERNLVVGVSIDGVGGGRGVEPFPSAEQIDAAALLALGQLLEPYDVTAPDRLP